MHFTNKWWCANFHLSISHLYVFLKLSILAFCLLSWVIFFFAMELCEFSILILTLCHMWCINICLQLHAFLCYGSFFCYINIFQFDVVPGVYSFYFPCHWSWNSIYLLHDQVYDVGGISIYLLYAFSWFLVWYMSLILLELIFCMLFNSDQQAHLCCMHLSSSLFISLFFQHNWKRLSFHSFYKHGYFFLRSLCPHMWSLFLGSVFYSIGNFSFSKNTED